MTDSVNQQEELKNEESLDADDCGKSAIAEKDSAVGEPWSIKFARGLGYACTSLFFAIPVMLTVFKKKK